MASLLDKTTLFLTELSASLQPLLLRFPILFRVKETIKRFYFFCWLGRKTDIFVLSYPKSGRTWLQILIGKSICEHFRFNDKWALDTYKLTKKSGINRIQFNHDGTDIQYARASHQLQQNKYYYKNKKVILLVRDPRDLVVSNYFQATKRRNAFKGTLSDFIRDERYGIHKIIRFYSIWANNAHIPKDFLLIKYEKLHKNAQAVLRDILNFIGITNIDDNTIEHVVKFSSFENLKKLEKSGYFKKRTMRPANKKDKESYKVRKGKVGGYDEYLSQRDIYYIQKVIREENAPFYN